MARPESPGDPFSGAIIIPPRKRRNTRLRFGTCHYILVVCMLTSAGGCTEGKLDIKALDQAWVIPFSVAESSALLCPLAEIFPLLLCKAARRQATLAWLLTPAATHLCFRVSYGLAQRVVEFTLSCPACPGTGASSRRPFSPWASACPV
ncbi:hypothetical protein LZ31DRAFT_361254 [Colletotrichum somersetense]|nr:hypothetical protein LZ31DRAFT_361254 [Colletotrichum somersetense]